MNDLNCEYVRDTYPDVLHGRADAALVQRVNAHLRQCDECRAEAAVLDALNREPVYVPNGLEERIAHAVRKPRARWPVSASSIGMAATLAAALIGGSIILNSQDEEPAVPAANVRPPAASSIGAVGVDAAMMSGKSSLEDLSVEQLEKLLGEMQS